MDEFATIIFATIRRIEIATVKLRLQSSSLSNHHACCVGSSSTSSTLLLLAFLFLRRSTATTSAVELCTTVEYTGNPATRSTGTLPVALPSETNDTRETILEGDGTSTAVLHCTTAEFINNPASRSSARTSSSSCTSSSVPNL